MEGCVMKTTALPEQMPRMYEGLVRLFVPRPIHDDVELDNVTEIVNRLATLDHPTQDQADYLDILSGIIETYENAHHAIDTTGNTALETLRFMLGESGMTASDLGRLLGSREIGSKILRGERSLSKAHIKKLAEHFHVSADLFLH